MADPQSVASQPPWVEENLQTKELQDKLEKLHNDYDQLKFIKRIKAEFYDSQLDEIWKDIELKTVIIKSQINYLYIFMFTEKQYHFWFFKIRHKDGHEYKMYEQISLSCIPSNVT